MNLFGAVCVNDVNFLEMATLHGFRFTLFVKAVAIGCHIPFTKTKEEKTAGLYRFTCLKHVSEIIHCITSSFTFSVSRII